MICQLIVLSLGVVIIAGDIFGALLMSEMSGGGGRLGRTSLVGIALVLLAVCELS